MSGAVSGADRRGDRQHNANETGWAPVDDDERDNERGDVHRQRCAIADMLGDSGADTLPPEPRPAAGTDRESTGRSRMQGNRAIWRNVLTSVAICLLAAHAAAAEFGHRGGPPPANVDEITGILRQDPYDLELLISFGTSKGGSAGHLGLAIRDGAAGDDLVHSANFYADRDDKHAADFYTGELMVRIPKKEYLFGTTSTVSAKASFGLDFGEIYKRSVVGIRVYGVPAAEKEALAGYFGRINDDFRSRARDTEYHHGEVKYDYLRLNCAKTIGSAFKFGAGYSELDVDNTWRLLKRPLARAANANIPTEIALKLIEQWNARGYGMDVVLYRKYPGSTWVDPQDEDKIAFKDLPDRFPSVLSRDFRRDVGEYRDEDNLFAAYLLYNLGRYSVTIDEATKRLQIERRKQPLPYTQAAEQARLAAAADSADFSGGKTFRQRGAPIGAE